ncbi:hypothetical protein DHB74_09065 [Pseudomonas sp. G11-1]|nr:hypothetical protein [Pseudomonas sp. G11-1]MCO5789722.1 hypothetical protein [Pseudomonas sp. G11-2]
MLAAGPLIEMEVDGVAIGPPEEVLAGGIALPAGSSGVLASWVRAGARTSQGSGTLTFYEP